MMSRTITLLIGALVLTMMASLAGCAPAANPTPSAPNQAPSATVVAPQPTTVVTQAVTPAAQPQASPTAAPVAQEFVVEETAIVANSVTKPEGHEYMDRISQEVLAKHAAERVNIDEKARVESANKVIGKYSYELKFRERADCKGCDNWDLYKGDKLILADIERVEDPQINAKGDDFALLVSAVKMRDGLLTTKGLEKWEAGAHTYTFPIYVGNDLVSVDSSEGGTTATVTRAGKVVYNTVGIGMRPDNPIKGLWSWDGHWVLEVDGKLVIDGKEMNKELGYDEVFDWSILNGQPFYFFKKNNKIGISYAGKVVPQQYDQVMHYQCCEPGMFNPHNYPTLTQFHALRDGIWYYVEAGIFDPKATTPAKTLYEQVVIPEQNLTFKAPAGWQRMGQEWAWVNNSTPPFKVGVKWHERSAGWEPTALLPANAVNQDAYDVKTEFGTGKCYMVQVKASAGEAKGQGTEERHYIFLTDKYAYDFYGIATDDQSLWRLGANLNDMVFSAKSTAKTGAAGATAVPTKKP